LFLDRRFLDRGGVRLRVRAIEHDLDFSHCQASSGGSLASKCG
jgi:hypothetical protein